MKLYLNFSKSKKINNYYNKKLITLFIIYD